jgi:phospholipid-binding lipoprotein MlaA
MHRIRTTLLATAQLIFLLLLTGCASARNPSDPFEPFNRGVYKFNDAVDRAVIKPVAQGYDYVMPTRLKIMASNFISNLDDVVVTVNDLLQFKFAQAASDGSRVLFNSTFGVFGLFDVASTLEKHDEDFGQTLGYWGVGSGPYLVLPFIGPSSMRDGPGLYVDAITGVEGHVDNVRARNQYYLASFIHKRASLLDEEKVLDEAAIDRYGFMRDTYLLHRKNLVYDGSPPREKFDYDE